MVRTRSRQEKAVESALHGLGIPCWLPLVERLRVYRRSKRRVQMPLFGGYVFARGTREQAWLGASSDRVAGLIEVCDQARLHRELSDLRRALEIERSLDVYPYLMEGVHVRVSSGALKGVEGIVDSRLGPERLVMRIHTLGQSTCLEIDPSLLEPVG
ncbi:MAG: transcription termination/antitermination NusG family protein [Phycisphaerales bacterium JB043]